MAGLLDYNNNTWLLAEPEKHLRLNLDYVTTSSARKRRAGIDVINSSDLWRARMIITLMCGQLDAWPRLECGMRVSVVKAIRRLSIGNSQ